MDFAAISVFFWGGKKILPDGCGVVRLPGTLENAEVKGPGIDWHCDAPEGI